jgi:hypothetical protein
MVRPAIRTRDAQDARNLEDFIHAPGILLLPIKAGASSRTGRSRIAGDHFVSELLMTIIGAKAWPW